MIKIAELVSKCKVHFLLLLLFVVSSISAKAQFLPNLKKAIDQGTAVVHSLSKLVDETKRSTSDYNKNVKVVKGNPSTADPRSEIPPAKKVEEPKFKDGKFTNFTWEPVSYFEGQLFPSSMICMSTYTGKTSPIIEAITRPLGFRIISKSSNIPLHWEIECVEKKYFDKVSGTVVFPQGGQEINLMPEVPWNYETLGTQVSSAPINVYFRIFDDEGHKEEKTIPIYVRSVNDCIYGYKDLALDFLFTGFIQEQHPEIDKILKEALNTKMISAILGYQSGPDYVDMQVAAIWRVLHERGFQYSSITTTTGNNSDIVSQQVRTFGNAIKTSQANCVDGTVVFASILRKIGIHTFLVLPQGHCFLGYYTDDAKTKVRFLETTMLDMSSYTDAKKRKVSLDMAKTNAAKNSIYLQLFIIALNTAQQEYTQDAAKYKVTTIDVDNMREFVKPMPIYN